MQNSLFNNSGSPADSVRHYLDRAWIDEFPNAVPLEQTDIWFVNLLRDIPWRQDQLKIAGRVIDVPRLQCWMGDRQSLYGYSGMRLVPETWCSPVTEIKALVEQLCKHKFNSVLLNYYRNGLDSVAWHADDEKELGASPVIASLSLGATRKFQLKPKAGEPGKKVQVLLKNGSLLLFSAELQRYWLHQVPKEKAVTEPRINLTFRHIID